MAPVFRIAFVQGRPEFGRTARNLELGLALAATVEADLVVLPELWSTGYVFSSRAEVAALAEDARTGATARALGHAARRERRTYVAGFAEIARGRVYNSAMLVGPSGVRSVYRKLHLFEREQAWFQPGDRPLEVHRVGPAKVGILICMDWRYPEAARVLALHGADVIAHPSNLVFRTAQAGMCTRAMENQVYIVTANRTGTERRPDGTVPFTGRSQIVGPDGAIRCAASGRASVAMAADCELGAARRKQLTSITPLFSNRRPEFYGALTARRGVAHPPRRFVALPGKAR